MTPTERRSLARSMRADGRTWASIGRALGVSYQRASQLGAPLRRKPGRPLAEEVWRHTTVAEWLAARVRAVEECAAAHGGER